MARQDQRHADEYRRELRSYVIGLLASLVLTAIAFALVAWHLLPMTWALGVVFALGLVQVAVHLRYFLHIGLHSHRDDLNLMLFSGVIILLLVGGTLIIMFNLQQRMV